MKLTRTRIVLLGLGLVSFALLSWGYLDVASVMRRAARERADSENLCWWLAEYAETTGRLPHDWNEAVHDRVAHYDPNIPNAMIIHRIAAPSDANHCVVVWDINDYVMASEVPLASLSLSHELGLVDGNSRPIRLLNKSHSALQDTNYMGHSHIIFEGYLYWKKQREDGSFYSDPKSMVPAR